MEIIPCIYVRVLMHIPRSCLGRVYNLILSHRYLLAAYMDIYYFLSPFLQEWVTDIPFIISPRITFEVSVRLLGGLMALGYTIATILKRSSHIFSDDRVCIKIDWLEQLNRKYIQVHLVIIIHTALGLIVCLFLQCGSSFIHRLIM